VYWIARLSHAMDKIDCENTHIKVIKCILDSGRYPFIKTCLGKYISYVLEQPGLTQFFIIRILETSANELESLLKKVCSILGMGCRELVQNFGLNSDLITSEPDKFYDIYGEFGTVSRLHEEGFGKIKKIRKPANEKQKTADFTAYYGIDKYAVEVKTIRPSEITEDRAMLKRGPNGLCFNINKLSDQIKNKLRDILPRTQEQLSEMARREKCNKKLVAIWVEREASRDLLGLAQDDYGTIYGDIRLQFPEIDYFLFNGTLWFPKKPQR